MRKKINYQLLAVLLFSIFILSFRINSGEVQPWDEGLYAMRAKVVLQYREIIDQSDHSIGGLYSATYPPLTPWAIALSMSILGENLFAIRLFSLICSAAGMIFMFLIAKRLFGEKFSYLIIFAFVGTLVWNTYSRQAMTDIPLTSFFIISLWSLIKINESEKRPQFLIYSVVFALSFAAALMTKMLISFLPLIFVGIYLFEKNKLKNKIWLLSASVSAVILSLPWHIYMIYHHGWKFLSPFSTPQLYSAVENNSKKLGGLYYFNQLIVSNPFLILSLVLMLIFIFRFKRFRELIQGQNNFIYRTMIIWFAGLLGILSISVTKMPYYALYMIPPGLFLAGLYYKRQDKLIKNIHIKWIIFSLLVLSFIWSISFDLRQSIKLILSHRELNVTGSFYLILILLLLFITIFAQRKIIGKILKYSFINLSYLFLVFIVARVLFFNALFPTGSILENKAILGGKATAAILNSMHIKSFIYLYHEHNSSDSLNPQLAWYTKGWTCGWIKGKTFKPMPMKKGAVDSKVLESTNNFPDSPIVYYTTKDGKLTMTDVQILARSRPILDREKDYIIFGYKENTEQ